jgi:hypothetical protein
MPIETPPHAITRQTFGSRLMGGPVPAVRFDRQRTAAPPPAGAAVRSAPAGAAVQAGAVLAVAVLAGDMASARPWSAARSSAVRWPLPRRSSTGRQLSTDRRRPHTDRRPAHMDRLRVHTDRRRNDLAFPPGGSRAP